MNKTWTFIAGIATGVILSFFILLLIGIGMQNSNNKGLFGAEFFDQPGKIISESNLKVIQVIDDGAALVEENSIWGSDAVMLLYDTNELYYDDQVINLPVGYAFREIGRYKYETNRHNIKTVPIIGIYKM